MEILKDFGINPLLLAAQVVNFFILLFILKRFLYKPVLKVLEERKKRIEESLKQAEEIEKKLQATEEQSEKIIAKSLQQAQKILDETKQAAARMLEGAKETSAEIISDANVKASEIVKIRQVMLEQQIREHAGDLIILAFEKIIGKRLTGKEQKEIIEEEMKNIS
ncbi:F0F1 ATP synthase subunit B [Candidatus Daviesbacteria bacterium]|nr:F0F1 ATP synthase subunit B [Candidatus Daviesbacteria bacterium]